MAGTPNFVCLPIVSGLKRSRAQKNDKTAAYFLTMIELLYTAPPSTGFPHCAVADDMFNTPLGLQFTSLVVRELFLCLCDSEDGQYNVTEKGSEALVLIH